MAEPTRTEREVAQLLREHEGRCRNVSELCRVERERSRIANARITGEVHRLCAVLEQLKSLGYDVTTLGRAVPQ